MGVIAGAGTADAIGTFGTPVAFTAAPVISGLYSSVATGLVFGSAPAMKAAKLDPVVALSSE